MKTISLKITMAASVLLWLIMGFDIRAMAETITYSAKFSTTDVTSRTIIVNDQSYVELSTGRGYYQGEPGEPSRPFATLCFAVPEKACDYTIAFANKVIGKTVLLSLPVYPVQHAQIINEYDPSLFIPAVDKTNTSWTRLTGKVLDDFIVNGNQKVVSIAVPMVEIATDFGSYTPINQLDIALSYNLSSQKPDKFTMIASPESTLDISLNALVVNSPAKQSVSKDEAQLKSVNERFVILTPEYLKESLKPVAQWKRQLGYTVEMFAFEDIISDDGGKWIDREEELREWIKSKFKVWGTFHLFIIGDEVAGAPIRKFHKKGNAPKYPGYENDYRGEYFIPSDWYFSDISTNFDLSEAYGDKYSGDIDNQPLSPQIPVGRLLVNNAIDLKTYLKKDILYELDPGLGDMDYLNQAAAFFQYFVRTEISCVPYLSGISSFNKMVDKHILPDNYQTNKPSGKEVIDAFKSCGIMSMHGHGSPFTIRCSGTGDAYQRHPYIVALSEYRTEMTGHINFEEGSALDNLNNDLKPAFGTSIACTVSPFDLYKPADREFPRPYYNFGAAFTVAGEFGGPAFVGNTRNGYTGISDVLEQEFGKQVNIGETIGKAMVKSSLTKIKTPYKTYDFDRWAIFTRCLIGDPSIKLWNGAPQQPSTKLEVQNGYLDLSSTNLGSCKVVLFDGEQNPYVSPVTFGTSVTLKIDDIVKEVGNDFMITILEPNTLPQSRLIANNSIVKDSGKTYVLRDGALTNVLAENTPCFTVKNNGVVNLTCTRGLNTQKAFNIETKGQVNLNAIGGQIKLAEDVVKTGGELNVKAIEILLDKGFSVEKGGKIECSVLK